MKTVEPFWPQALKFSYPQNIGSFSVDQILPLPGLYAFTTTPGALRYGNVLYIGKTDTSLRNRIGGYLNGRHRHKGALFLYNYRRRNGTKDMFVLWAYWDRPVDFEGDLIKDLVPAFNSRREAGYPEE